MAHGLCCMHSEEFLAAAQEGDTATVLALLARGVDVDSKAYDGYGSRDSIVVSLVCQRAGRTVRPLGVERQECLGGLCRWTALHWASLQGNTKTAMALVKAGADVRCKADDG